MRSISGIIISKIAAAPTFISNGSTTDFECDKTAGWTNNDDGNGDSSAVTFDGKSAFKLDGGTPFDVTNLANRVKNLSAVGIEQRNVVTYIIYPQALIDIAGFNILGAMRLDIYLGSGKGYVHLLVFSDGIASLDGTYYTIVSGENLIGAWHNITIDITYIGIVGTFDIYLNNDLVGTDLAIVPGSNTLGRTDLFQYSGIDDSPTYIQKLSYIDRILIGDNFA